VTSSGNDGVYFSNLSQKTGPVKYRGLPTGSISVLEAPDNHMPIGEASCRGWDENGLAVWTLRVRGQPIEGRWVIIDRQFKPA
jgi:hypothetical protein